MTEIWLLYDSFTCMICYHQYSQSHHVPMEICRNNHLICSICYRMLVRNCTAGHKDDLKCPFCKQRINKALTRPYKNLITLKQATLKAIEKEKELAKLVEFHTQNNKLLQQQLSEYQRKIQRLQGIQEQLNSYILQCESELKNLQQRNKLMAQVHYINQGVNNRQELQSLVRQKDKRIDSLLSYVFALREQGRQIKKSSASSKQLMMNNNFETSFNQQRLKQPFQRKFSQQKLKNVHLVHAITKLQQLSCFKTQLIKSENQKSKLEFRRHQTWKKLLYNSISKEKIKKFEAQTIQNMKKDSMSLALVNKQSKS